MGFHRWVHAKQKEIEDKMLAEGAVDLAGMGFTSSPATIKDMADKAKRREETRKKLAAVKAERAREEMERAKAHRSELRAKERRESINTEKAAAQSQSPAKACRSAVDEKAELSKIRGPKAK